MKEKVRQSFGPWWAWLIIAVIYLLLRVNIINVPLDRDEGSFGYIGQVILKGGIPYKDVFEVRPPVVYYLNALALLLFGPTPRGIHFFLHIYNFLTLIVVFFIGKELSKSNTAGLWSSFIYAVFSSIPYIEGCSASAEMLALLPVALSLLFVLLAVDKHKLYYSFLSGAFGAFGFWTKVTVFPILSFIFIYLLSAQIYLNLKQKIYLNYANIAKSALNWCIGFASVSMIIIFYFYYHGVLGELIFWCFTRGLCYIKKIDTNTGREIGNLISLFLKEIFKGNLAIILMGAAGILFEISRKRLRGLFILGFLFFSLMAVMPGYGYRHYLAQIAVSVAIAGGTGFFFLAELLNKRAIKTAVSLLYAITTAVTPLWIYPWYYYAFSGDEISHHLHGANPFPESVDIAKFIKERTDKDDAIYIIGSEPQILLYSRLKNACSFPAIYQLILDYPRHKEFQERAWEEIEISSPKYICAVNVGFSFIYDKRGSLWIIEKLEDLIDNKYVLEAVMTIDYPKGKLYLASEHIDLQEIIKNRAFIEIYRRRNPDS